MKEKKIERKNFHRVNTIFQAFPAEWSSVLFDMFFVLL